MAVEVESRKVAVMDAFKDTEKETIVMDWECIAQFFFYHPDAEKRFFNFLKIQPPFDPK